MIVQKFNMCWNAIILSGSIDLKYIKRVFEDIKNAYDPTFVQKI